MAERVLRQLVDGSEAGETVRFGYAGRGYEIDLSEAHAAELGEFLAPYVDGTVGSIAGGGAAQTQGQGRRREMA